MLSLIERLITAFLAAWAARPDPVASSSREAGGAEAELAVNRSALEAQWRVTQAAEAAPRTDAQVDDLLSKGEA